ncbi:MAG: TonB-dependent receptor [Methylococcaceae bacterium]|nr:TonB-dependent receptor [Methylococcaceae bacterium]
MNFADRTYTGNKAFPNPGYLTVDLMAGYSKKIGDATISAQLNVSNLLDQYYTTRLNANTAQNFASVTFGAPRTFMGQVSIQY